SNQSNVLPAKEFIGKGSHPLKHTMTVFRELRYPRSGQNVHFAVLVAATVFVFCHSSDPFPGIGTDLNVIREFGQLGVTVVSRWAGKRGSQTVKRTVKRDRFDNVRLDNINARLFLHNRTCPVFSLVFSHEYQKWSCRELGGSAVIAACRGIHALASS